MFEIREHIFATKMSLSLMIFMYELFTTNVIEDTKIFEYHNELQNMAYLPIYMRQNRVSLIDATASVVCTELRCRGWTALHSAFMSRSCRAWASS